MIAQRNAVMPLTLLFGLVVLQSGATAAWWSQPSLRTVLPLALVGWLVGLWSQRRESPAVGLPVVPAPAIAAVPGSSPPPKRERRRDPRFDIRVPVTFEVARQERRDGELRDISQGGARIAGIVGLEPDTVGVLRISGITLPVPCVVLASTPRAELRLRFDLSGLALDAFVGQLDRLTATASVQVEA